MSETLDTIDAKILDLIQKDASLSVADIADRVGLSSSPCWRRIKRMEEAGIINGRVTLLDRQALGLGFEVIANVKLALPSKENLEAFEKLVGKWSEVTECMTVTGAVMTVNIRVLIRVQFGRVAMTVAVAAMTAIIRVCVRV